MYRDTVFNVFGDIIPQLCDKNLLKHFLYMTVCQIIRDSIFFVHLLL